MKKKKRKFNTTLVLALYFFAVLFVSLIALIPVVFILEPTYLIADPDYYDLDGWAWLFIDGQFVFLSIYFALVTTLFLRFAIFKPLKKLTDASRKVADGNFDVRLSPRRRELKEIDELYTNFNEMTADLESVKMMRNDFISDFSHEFKTPIASIQGFADLLLDDEIAEDEKQKFLTIISEESGRLSRLATNILDLSNYESTTRVTEKSAVKIDEQIRTTLLQLEKKWGEKEIQLDMALEPAEILTNPDLTKQVWFNLLDNAIKFSEYEGCIKIALKKKENEIVVRIADDGVGMEGEVLARVFEKFYQADASRNVQGHGLGLAIVRRIVELLEGEISVESQVGVGTTFEVKLPLERP